jgi:hypothetical protein
MGDNAIVKPSFNQITRTSFVLVGVFLVASVVAFIAPVSGHAGGESAPTYVIKIPAAYRDWRLVSVAHEAGSNEDIRAILGNDAAIKAYRDGTIPFPDGTIITRIAWSFDMSEENDKLFCSFIPDSCNRPQSFVAGPPKNGVQFMVKDSKKYAATGGWGFGQFDEGKPVSGAVLKTCFPCHSAGAAFNARDLVFTRYAP